MSAPDVSDAGTDSVKAGQRAIHLIAAVLVVVVLPVVLMDVLVGTFAANAMFLGLIYGVAGGKLGGTRRMASLAPLVGIAAGLGALTAYNWWWVLVIAVSGLVAGAGMRWGWFPPLLMVPVAATFAAPVSSNGDALAYGVIAAIATLYGVALARRFKAPDIVEGQRVTAAQAVVVALAFAAVLAASSAIGVALGWAEPYWVPEPILILAAYVVLGMRERIWQKATGTALGAAGAVVVAIASPPHWAIAVIASAAFVLAVLVYKKSYAASYGLYTFGIVIALSSPSTTIGTEAVHRGSEILIGIGLLVVGLAIVHPLAAWLARRYPDPVLA